jgi:ATP-dependent helicase STH1/SNF2
VPSTANISLCRPSETARVQQLKADGATTDTSPELANLTRIILAVQAQRQRAQGAHERRGSVKHRRAESDKSPRTGAVAEASAVANGVPAKPAATPAAAALSAPVPVAAGASPATADPYTPTISPTTVPFTPEQVAALKCQVVAFRLLARNQPLPAILQAALASPSDALKYVDSLVEGQDALKGDELDPEAVAAARAKALASEGGVETVEDVESLVYPYNAFATPREVLRSYQGGRTQDALLVPTLLPAGLDPQTIIDERNRFIEARIHQRRRELEQLPSNLGQNALPAIAPGAPAEFAPSLASQKIRTLIEIKSLNLVERQRALREQVVQSMRPACSLSLPLDRSLFRRSRKPTLRDATAIEGIEKRQKQERERRAKQKHLDHLAEITEHGRNLLIAHRTHDVKFQKLGKALLKFHVDAEREEQKRVERVSKERLKALRADDEEGYLKLIDTAKDTRITHLLRQTDSFLDSLAAAVSAQQQEARAEVQAADGTADEEEKPASTEAVDESRFGAVPVFAEETKDKVDYYNVAHRVKETITKQPSILVGGELKGYQLRGLEWMVSLYNNHVNGILADEMGLGKTIQTLSLITYLIETKKQPGPYLVIVPLSTMPNWISEFEKWAPSVRVVSYKGTPAQRKNAQAEIRQGNFQVLLTTYEYIIKDRPLLSKIKWLHMIIDEGHRMKNTQSRLSLTLTQHYSSRYRLILTGTPLQVSDSPLHPVHRARLTVHCTCRTTCRSCGHCSTLYSRKSSAR